MVDLGYKGCKYTWTNKRFSNRRDLIFERRDKCVANDPRIKQFPEATVTHSPRTKSDHCPLLVNLYHPHRASHSKPFRLEPMWCRHPSFGDVIQRAFDNPGKLHQAITSFQSDAITKNKVTFGNLFSNIKNILAGLDVIQRSPHFHHSTFLQNLEKGLLAKYDTLLKCEEDFCKTKSRINWLRKVMLTPGSFIFPPSTDEGIGLLP